MHFFFLKIEIFKSKIKILKKNRFILCTLKVLKFEYNLKLPYLWLRNK